MLKSTDTGSIYITYDAFITGTTNGTVFLKTKTSG